MISKGKRKFLVDLLAVKIFRDTFMVGDRIDIIALCQRAQRVGSRKSRWENMTVHPYRRPSPETEAKLKEITDNIMARYLPNGENNQG